MENFQERVLQGLENIRTKMDILVGPDGTNGKVGDMEHRISSLEKARWVIAGAILAVGAVIHFIFKY